jgi:hypothetical protein
LLETGHFQIAKVGSIQHANQQIQIRTCPIFASGHLQTI